MKSGCLSRIVTLWLSFAEKGLLEETARFEGNARALVFLASLYTAYEQHEKAHLTLQRGRAVSPNKQDIIISQAANALARGDTQEARAHIENAYILEPSYDRAAELYAIRLIREGDYTAFGEVFAGNTHLGSSQRVLSLLVEAAQHERALGLWEQAFKAELEPRIAFLLAQVYATKGDMQRAIASIERAYIIDPRAREEGERVIETLQ